MATQFSDLAWLAEGFDKMMGKVGDFLVTIGSPLAGAFDSTIGSVFGAKTESFEAVASTFEPVVNDTIKAGAASLQPLVQPVIDLGTALGNTLFQEQVAPIKENSVTLEAKDIPDRDFFVSLPSPAYTPMGRGIAMNQGAGGPLPA